MKIQIYKNDGDFRIFNNKEQMIYEGKFEETDWVYEIDIDLEGVLENLVIMEK